MIANPTANAFVLPGGKVVVFSGMLQLLDEDKELAAVLSHEVAHVLGRHVVSSQEQGSTTKSDEIKGEG